MSDDKIQWHTGFATVLEWELKEYLHALQIHREYHLASKPLEIDILIVKKIKDVQINKNIAQIFKEHNIIEYKSPEDYISIDDYYKVKIYAYLYKTLGEHIDERKIDDMSITMVSSSYPQKMVKHIIKTQGVSITKKYDGIYYIEGEDIVSQIIVVDELSPKEARYLRLLTVRKNLKDVLPDFIKEFANDPKDTGYETVMDILFQANMAQVMEVFEMAKTITKTEMEAVERVVLKFNLNSKWIEEGEEKGEKNGEKKRNFEIARNMLFEGCNVEFISKVTGLALDIVRGLKREMDN